jgi:hypothetical protein
MFARVSVPLLRVDGCMNHEQRTSTPRANEARQLIANGAASSDVTSLLRPLDWQRLDPFVARLCQYQISFDARARRNSFR